VAAREGIELVLGGMRAHAQVASVQWAGCWAIFCLGVHNPDVQREVVTHGGVEAAMKAMDSHRAEAKVQESACWVLKDLAKHAMVLNSMALSGVIQSVLRAMEKHPKVNKVQTAANSALRQLAMHDTEGWVKSSILGRCGRMGWSTTQRALSAIQEE
jgi:hypothetical protein